MQYLQDGEPCPLCGEPMHRGQELDADHSHMLMHGDRNLPDRLAHASCNRIAGVKARWARHRTRQAAREGQSQPLNTSRRW